MKTNVLASRVFQVGAIAALIAGSAFAGGVGFEIPWYTMDGGGGTSTSAGGTFELSGTIGQPDAGQVMSGGSFTLTGGFWFPVVTGDCNVDGAVTGNDYVEFEGCVSGEGGGLPMTDCTCSDFDNDGDVDLVDYAEFVLSFSNTMP